MHHDAEAPRGAGIDRRSFLKSAAVGTATFVAGASLLSWARPAQAAGTLANVQSDAAKAAKNLLNGRAVTLRILHPSGSLGNIKPVADKWTAETGIKIEYAEVPLGEINQKVLLEAVSKAGSFDIALPASFGIPDLAESGILDNLDQLAAKYEPEDYQDSIIYKTANNSSSALIRLDLRIEFRRLQKALGQTLVYVTHDQVEALSLADRVAVLHEGRLLQVDSPERLYEKPVNRFVAEFIGRRR
jgi:hypothetical protein